MDRRFMLERRRTALFLRCVTLEQSSNIVPTAGAWERYYCFTGFFDYTAVGNREGSEMKSSRLIYREATADYCWPPNFWKRSYLRPASVKPHQSCAAKG
jgi:hypothetical protein